MRILFVAQVNIFNIRKDCSILPGIWFLFPWPLAAEIEGKLQKLGGKKNEKALNRIFAWQSDNYRRTRRLYDLELFEIGWYLNWLDWNGVQ